MQVLVLGAGGMLGQQVVREFGDEAVGLDRAACDIANPEHIAKLALGEFSRPQWIVNCAAYTKVDRAETEPQAAYDANALGPSYLSSAAADLGARVVHISTDFVFDGAKGAPYTEDDPTHPLGVYGQSKWQGEQNVAPAVILRTSWVFGPTGPCFPQTMIRAHDAGKQLRVVSDQIGTPTYTAELARVVRQAVQANIPNGIYHAAGPDIVTWHAFAEAILTEWTGKPVQIEAIPTEAYPTPAKRPPYSALDSSRLATLGIGPMAPLSQTIPDYIRRLKQIQENSDRI